MIEERTIEKAIEYGLGKVQPSSDLLDRINRQAGNLEVRPVTIRPSIWVRSRLGPKLEFLAACVVLVTLIGVGVYRNIGSSQTPAGGHQVPNKAATFTNRTYGFSVDYPPTWEVNARKVVPPPPAGTVFGGDNVAVDITVWEAPTNTSEQESLRNQGWIEETITVAGEKALSFTRPTSDTRHGLWRRVYFEHNGRSFEISLSVDDKDQGEAAQRVFLQVIQSLRWTAPTSEDASATPDLGIAHPAPLVPVASAAAPGVAPESVLKDAEAILQQAKIAVKALDLSESADGYKEFRISAPNLVFTCRYSSPGAARDEAPLLACKFGEAVNTVTGHALFWRDGTEWHAQLYPQALADVAQQRHDYFEGLGENCPVGCGAEFRMIRQSGDELLAVVDLSGVSTNTHQEVHLLKRDGQQWRILWVPAPQAFRFSGHSKVTLAAQGIGQFTVSYDDGSSQTWVRHGAEFVPKEN